MKKLALFLTLLVAGASLPAQTPAPVPAPATAAMTTPAMVGILAANPVPTKVDLGSFLGSPYITGAVSGFGQWQTNTIPGDYKQLTDIANAQVVVQKTDGQFQYYLQAGIYSLPDLGLPYLRSGPMTTATFGPLPQVFVKYAPTDSFNIQVGKLPTLIGAECTWSFENSNIERGLLWNQENAVNRGIQLNYTSGAMTYAVSWNDGLYSNRYSWLWGMASYAIDKTNTLTFIAGGNTKITTVSTFATPIFLNNEQIYNLIYVHTAGPWTLEPYLQYTSVPKSGKIGTGETGTTFGAALLATYAFGNGFSLPFRVEYISSTGSAANGAPNLLYGAGSKACSFTITPTYQYKTYFARAELSFVSASKTTPGAVFGPLGNDKTQTRFALETGILF